MAINIDVFQKMDDLLAKSSLERILLALSIACDERDGGQHGEFWKEASTACAHARDIVLKMPKPIGRGGNGNDKHDQPF